MWKNICAEAFPYQQYSVASQQPPTDDPDDERRIDIAIRPLNRVHGSRAALLLFIEAERTGANSSLASNCEEQALAACQEYLAPHKMEAVWAMTCVGSKTRIWAYTRRAIETGKREDAYLIPVFPPGTGLGDIDKYAEVNENGLEVLNWLEYIKANPVPPETIFTGSSAIEVPVLPS